MLLFAVPISHWLCKFWRTNSFRAMKNGRTLSRNFEELFALIFWFPTFGIQTFGLAFYCKFQLENKKRIEAWALNRFNFHQHSRLQPGHPVTGFLSKSLRGAPLLATEIVVDLWVTSCESQIMIHRFVMHRIFPKKSFRQTYLLLELHVKYRSPRICIKYFSLVNVIECFQSCRHS